ncbi:MAG: DUF3800 domain-containing protein [Clostridia bacterium]|nr:DUF3800 domain-containing protein [Clostridia bacterium]MBR5427661.1 DUF3800 domain-containing protein [Clostridia bacterium]
MKELSVFIDESGDFGEVVNASPYYIVTFVCHDQDNDIGELIERLDRQLKDCGFEDEYIHTHPLIRKEDPYRNLSIDDRRRILNKMLRFTMACDISYFNIVVNKTEAADKFKLSAKIAKELSRFIRENLSFFQNYSRIIVYYDYGQQELSVIINTILNTMLSDVEFRNASPKKYKLLQVADFICSMELLKQKREHNQLTKSELSFFYKPNELKRNYIKSVEKKRFPR